MIVTFCLSNFTNENLRLQPWLTIHRIGLGLLSSGHEVHILTDHKGETIIDGMQVHWVKSLRGTNSNQIQDLLQSIRPDSVVVSVTPLSLVTAAWYQILRSFRSYAFLSYSFYSYKEIFKAFSHLNNRERIEYGRHVLVPRLLWTRRFIRLFDGVICQSKHTSEVIRTYTRNRIPVHAIPPGIDRELWFAEDGTPCEINKSFFLYVGRASAIRGFFIVLDAFSQIKDQEIRLKIIARGADNNEIKKIEKEVFRRNMQERVIIQGGWLEIDELRQEFQSAMAVILPFVLVPSELPVSVMEAISCGTPVIVSDIDGLSDATGKAGFVVRQCDINEVSMAIEKIYREKKVRKSLHEACFKQAEDMLPWISVAEQWENLLSG